MDRISPLTAAQGAAQGHQRWHQLLFSHWEVPVDALRPLLPAALSVDTFEQRAFVGVVAFTMQKVRPFSWLPSAPTAREFAEINLRTYVHLNGSEPGVYFFSLDAGSKLAVWAARRFWGLPYYYGDFAYSAEPPAFRYRCERAGVGKAFLASARVGAQLSQPRPGSLEFFLCERYQFYAKVNGRLCRARVRHPPYALHAVEEAQVDPLLLELAQLPTMGPMTPHLFSPGVDVEIFPLTPAE